MKDIIFLCDSNDLYDKKSFEPTEFYWDKDTFELYQKYPNDEKMYPYMPLCKGDMTELLNKTYHKLVVRFVENPKVVFTTGFNKLLYAQLRHLGYEPYDVGATSNSKVIQARWLNKHHPEIFKLLRELDL